MGGAAGSGPARLEPPERGIQVSSGVITLQPGEEYTTCHFLDLPNDAPIDVIKLEQQNGGFAHHFVMHLAGEDFPPGLDDCPGGLYLTHPAIYPGTRDQVAFELPDGVSMPLEARQPILTQIHLLNTTPDVVTEELLINLHTGDPDQDYERAGIIGGADLDFTIPPRTEYTATQQCTIGVDVNVFAMTSHSHARTVSFDVSTNIAGEITPIYHSEDWDSPLVKVFDPDLFVPAREGFEFSCTWNNDDDVEVRYGDLASDEMCIFFGYYYPSIGGAAPCLGI